jgi:hypothetical protein
MNIEHDFKLCVQVYSGPRTLGDALGVLDRRPLWCFSTCGVFVGIPAFYMQFGMFVNQ